MTPVVHLWQLDFDRARIDTIETMRGALPPREADRAGGIAHAGRRAQFVVGRTLLRHALSTVDSRDPVDWIVDVDAAGRPSVANPSGARLEVSLAHTRGRVSCAVSIARSVGVDVEALSRSFDVPRVASRALSDSERRAVDGPRRVLELWTLKEAYFKARGRPLVGGFRAISFEVDPHGGVRAVALDDDDPRRWQFRLQTPCGRFATAVALERDEPDRFDVQVERPELVTIMPG